MRMTRKEKERFVAFLASVFAPPDEDLLADPEGQEISFPEAGKVSLPALKEEYRRLFSDPAGERISLAESTYKPWTADPDCLLGFSGQTGWLMGDCALHLQSIFQALSLEVPPDFRGTPDHLVLELELLSFLYRSASEEQIRQFIGDHLDWVANLREEIQKRGSGFYGGAAARLQDFLTRETLPPKEKTDEPQILP